MAKRKKRLSREQRQILSQPKINITNEVNYIIERAQEGDTRIVSLVSLIWVYFK